MDGVEASVGFISNGGSFLDRLINLPDPLESLW